MQLEVRVKIPEDATYDDGGVETGRWWGRQPNERCGRGNISKITMWLEVDNNLRKPVGVDEQGKRPKALRMSAIVVVQGGEKEHQN